MKFFSSQEAARLLGRSHLNLLKLIWRGVVPAPRKFGASYQWTRADIERARELLDTIRPYRRKPEVADAV